MTRVLRRSFLPPWVVVSAVLHVALFLGAGAGIGLLPANGVMDGDGWGGQSIEVEIAGPDDGAPHGALHPMSDRSSPQPEIPPPPEEEVEEEVATVEGGEVPVAAAEPTRPRRPEPPAEQPPQPAVEAGRAPVPGTTDTNEMDDPSATANAAAPGEHPEPSGTGGDGTLAGPPAGDVSGLILGSAGMGGSSVTPRTALLPNAGVCADPVAGTWRAQKFRTSDHTWVRFILQVRHEASGELRGTITSRIWTGNRSNPNPGTCTAFGMDHTWRMTARGHYGGEEMSFHSSGGARLIRQDCPRSDSSYAPDHFTGRIRVMQEVWDTVNNDGAYDVDEPYTFRRVSCE